MKKAVIAIFTFVLLLTFSSCVKPSPKALKSSPEQIKTSAEEKNKVNIILFLPSKDENFLVPISLKVDFNNSLERTIVEEILKEPKAQNVSYIIPKGTKLLSIMRKEDTIIIDFSKEFSNISKDNINLLNNTIYSIVNSLTEIPGIKNVIIKVEGKPFKIGDISSETPLKRNRNLLKRDKTSNPREILKRQMDLEVEGRYLEAYLLYSDDENNTYRKYFDYYVKENEEAAAQGFISKNFTVGDYIIDSTGKHALVKVMFKDTNRELKIGMVKIEDAWLVDWTPPQ